MPDAGAPGCLQPDWPAPPQVRALTTYRYGGFSKGAWRSFNLALHTGDDPAHVCMNRELLQRVFELPAEPAWLEQVHGRSVVHIGGNAIADRRADGSWTENSGTVCAVMTADCLPLLLCDRAGTRVAAVHAGWKGLCNGIIENAIASLCVSPRELLAWLGPAIGPRSYQVGSDVCTAFSEAGREQEAVFEQQDSEHWLLDVYATARNQLQAGGISHSAVFGGNACTCSDADKYFSYRRDGVCGRMASLIWLNPAD